MSEQANQQAARERADAYTGWFLYGAEVNALLPRIDAAIERITSGQGCMRIPANMEDPDLVLADCKRMLKKIVACASPVLPASEGVEKNRGG